MLLSADGVVHISYAYSKDPKLEGSDVIYIRHVSYPLMVTVYHMLECSGMDLLPFPVYPETLRLMDFDLKNQKPLYLNASEGVGWCLFSIEVRNSYGSPFVVTLERTQGGESTVSSTTTIPPGSVSRYGFLVIHWKRETYFWFRLVIPIKKIILDQGTVTSPIPTLSDKQFVVVTSNLSEAEERAQRELFWYREELFKCVSAHWREASTSTSFLFFLSIITSPRLVEIVQENCLSEPKG